MDRSSWLYVLAGLILAVALGLAFAFPDVCALPTYPSGHEGYQRQTPSCQSREVIRVAIVGAGAIVAVGLLAVVSKPRR